MEELTYINAISAIRELVREETGFPCNLITAKRIADMATWKGITFILHPHFPAWPEGYYYENGTPDKMVSIKVRWVNSNEFRAPKFFTVELGD